MANPSSVGVAAWQPAMVVTDTTGGSTTLDPNKQYLIKHTGLDNSSTPGASTGTAYLTVGQSGTAITANGVEGSNKYPILSGDSQIIGPGITTLGWRAAAGTPVLSVLVLQTDFGRHRDA